MSAEVIIMNKDGLALAADSAVTITGTNGKIFNSSDKLFALSKYHPVGIMNYGDANFMGIKWDTIIKSYRDFLGEKSFDKLIDYENDFLHYLAAFPYISEDQMVRYLKSRCQDVCSQVLSRIINDLRTEFGEAEDIQTSAIESAFNTSLKTIKDNMMNDPENEKHIKLDTDFIDDHSEVVQKTFKMIFEEYPLSEEQNADLTAILKLHFQKRGYIDDYGGIVIAGFGEREIFPSVCELKVSGKIGDSLIYFGRETIQAHSTSSLIMPFAQGDVIDQFVYGADFALADRMLERFGSILGSVAPSLDDGDREKKHALIDLLVEYTRDIMAIVYKNPIRDIVRVMEIQEMVLMAEALINLTALKRRVSDEAESVGGPVDVAQITKNEGFIWIKRKTRYDPHLNMELNQNYFRRWRHGKL